MKLTDKIQGDGKLSSAMETLLLCLYYVLACVYIPLCSFLSVGETAVSVISLVICVLSLLALGRAAGTFKAVIGYAVILGIFMFFGGGLTILGMFSAFTTATCIYSHLLLKRSSPIIWGIPAIPLVVALLTVGNATSAVIALAPLPAALMLTWAMKEGVGRVSAVCRISSGICLVAAAVFACSVYSAYGDISLSLCKQAIDAVKTVMTDAMIAIFAELESTLGEEMAIGNAEEIVRYAVGVAFNVLPAMIIIVANVVSYIIHSMMLSIEYVSLEDKKEAMPMMAFEMSIVSAIVFFLALALTFILNNEMYSAAAENVMLVLMPGLILTALSGLRALFAAKGPSCLGSMVYVLAIFMVATLNYVVLITASAIGAVLIIISNVAQAKANK